VLKLGGCLCEDPFESLETSDSVDEDAASL